MPTLKDNCILICLIILKALGKPSPPDALQMECTTSSITNSQHQIY